MLLDFSSTKCLALHDHVDLESTILATGKVTTTSALALVRMDESIIQQRDCERERIVYVFSEWFDASSIVISLG
jgi:hypothetical protein